MHEHEPVAWINYNAATGEETINRECHSELASTPLYKTPLQNEITCVCGAVWDGKLMTIPPRENKHKPVAWMYEWGGRTNFTTTDQRFVEAVYPHFVKATPLYTAPPKREWVGLTDDEVFNIYKQFDSLQYKSFAQAIEVKLKEKNA